MIDIRKLLFDFAFMRNNYRKFECNEDLYNVIDEFLSKYQQHDQPERLNPETNDEKLERLFPNGKCPHCQKGIWESLHLGCESLDS